MGEGHVVLTEAGGDEDCGLVCLEIFGTQHTLVEEEFAGFGVGDCALLLLGDGENDVLSLFALVLFFDYFRSGAHGLQGGNLLKPGYECLGLLVGLPHEGQQGGFLYHTIHRGDLSGLLCVGKAAEVVSDDVLLASDVVDGTLVSA